MDYRIKASIGMVVCSAIAIILGTTVNLILGIAVALIGCLLFWNYAMMKGIKELEEFEV